MISGAGNLSAKYVIHAVGPVWSGGTRGEADLLAKAIQRSLKLAMEHDCRSVAIPALSAGANGYPLADAAHIALATTADFLLHNRRSELVRFVQFDERALTTFRQALRLLQEGK